MQRGGRTHALGVRFRGRSTGLLRIPGLRTLARQRRRTRAAHGVRLAANGRGQLAHIGELFEAIDEHDNSVDLRARQQSVRGDVQLFLNLGAGQRIVRIAIGNPCGASHFVDSAHG